MVEYHQDNLIKIVFDGQDLTDSVFDRCNLVIGVFFDLILFIFLELLIFDKSLYITSKVSI